MHSPGDTSECRRTDVAATSIRRINVSTTAFRCHVPAEKLLALSVTAICKQQLLV